MLYFQTCGKMFTHNAAPKIYFRAKSNKAKIIASMIDGAIPVFQSKCDLIAPQSKAPSTVITNLGAIKYWCRILCWSVITAGQRNRNKTQPYSSVQSSIVCRALLVSNPEMMNCWTPNMATVVIRVIKIPLLLFCVSQALLLSIAELSAETQ